MGISFVRTIILYVMVIFAMRIMGKRTLGEMHPTEMVVSIMISDLATVPMQSKSTPLFDGIIPIFTIVVLELVFAFLVLKSRAVRRVLVGRSCNIVKNGKMLEKEMANLRVTVEDVEEQIRIGGYTSLKEIAEVIMETNGQISIVPKGVNRPVTTEDLKINAEESKTPFLIISDGRLRKKDMLRAHIGMTQISKELEKRGVNSVKEVLYMSGVDSHVVHFQKKGDVKNA